MDCELTIASWNIHGLGCDDRVKVAEQWMRGTGKEAKVLALQEMKAGEDRLEFNVRKLIPGAHCMIDYSMSDRGGAAIVIHPSIKVLEGGIKGDGSMAWAVVETKVGRKQGGKLDLLRGLEYGFKPPGFLRAFTCAARTPVGLLEESRSKLEPERCL
ncbi:hypothetical protein R1sor_023972 [Riccia sorocarpa]|uniref:Endonuclease/exonuclease/phosphatase domain-containing protein n=1 Tax=Riccia sorocarpa TaxID=122646 RepID=A0ABD3GR06_9MARC